MIELEAVRHATVEASAEVGHGLVVELERLARDLELHVELAQQEIVGRDVADERHEDAGAGLIGREIERVRRLVLASEPAEQVELPGQLKPVVTALARRCPRSPLPR